MKILLLNFYRCTIRFPSTKLKLVFQILVGPSAAGAITKPAVQPTSSVSSKTTAAELSSAPISPCPSPSGTLRLVTCCRLIKYVIVTNTYVTGGFSMIEKLRTHEFFVH